MQKTPTTMTDRRLQDLSRRHRGKAIYIMAVLKAMHEETCRRDVLKAYSRGMDLGLLAMALSSLHIRKENKVCITTNKIGCTKMCCCVGSWKDL